MNTYTFSTCPRCGFLTITDMHSCPTVLIPYRETTGYDTHKVVKVNKNGVAIYAYGTIRTYGTGEETQA